MLPPIFRVLGNEAISRTRGSPGYGVLPPIFRVLGNEAISWTHVAVLGTECSLQYLEYLGMRLYPGHIWQSWVEIEHYCIPYFDYVTTFEVLQRRTSIKGGGNMHCVNVSSIHGFMVYALRMSPAFDRRSAIQCFKCINVDFYLGLPYMVIHCTHSTVTHTLFSQRWEKQGPLNSRVTNSTSSKSLKKP